MKLSKKELGKIPLKKWKKMLKELYNIELLEIRAFLLGHEDPNKNEANNGFLELSCFCNIINQATIDISEEMFRIYILDEGTFVKKKITITLETEVIVNDKLPEDNILKIAFPDVMQNLKHKIQETKVV